MEIGQVPVGYSLCPDRCHTVGDKLIPAGNGKLATHVERTPLKAQELRGEFGTMRYTAEHIPVFRLWFGDKAVTGLSTCDGLSGRGAGIPTLRPYRNTASSSRFLPTAAWRCARGSTPMSKTGRTEEHSTDRGG